MKVNPAAMAGLRARRNTNGRGLLLAIRISLVGVNRSGRCTHHSRQLDVMGSTGQGAVVHIGFNRKVRGRIPFPRSGYVVRVETRAG